MIKKSVLFLVILFLPFVGFTKNFNKSLNSSLGLVNVSINESESTLESDDPDAIAEAQTTSASVTAFELNYEFLVQEKRSYFAKAIVPITTTGGSGVFLGGIGANFYLNPLASAYSYEENGSSITIRPKFRYYWGGSVGVGNLIYSTDTAKKSDVFFDLSLHGGGIYNFSNDWGARAEASFGRGTGAATSSTAIKIFFGASYYL